MIELNSVIFFSTVIENETFSVSQRPILILSYDMVYSFQIFQSVLFEKAQFEEMGMMLHFQHHISIRKY